MAKKDSLYVINLEFEINFPEATRIATWTESYFSLLAEAVAKSAILYFVQYASMQTIESYGEQLNYSEGRNTILDKKLPSKTFTYTFFFC